MEYTAVRFCCRALIIINLKRSLVAHCVGLAVIMTIQRPGFGTIDLDFKEVKHVFQFSLKDSHVYLLFMKNGDHYVLDSEEFFDFECEANRIYGYPVLSHMWVLGENNTNWWNMED